MMQVECCNFLILNGRYVLQHESFLTIFSLQTEQLEVSGSNQNRNPFKTLNLNRNPILCKDVSKIYLRRTQIFEDYELGRFSIFYLVFNLYTFLVSLSSIFVFSLFFIRFFFCFLFLFRIGRILMHYFFRPFSPFIERVQRN